MEKVAIKKMLEDLYTTVFTEGNWEALDKYYIPDVEAYFNGRLLSLDDLKAGVRAAPDLYENVETDIQDMIIAEDKTATRFSRTMVRKEDGEILEMEQVVIKHLKNGKITNLWTVCNSNDVAAIWD
jgi:ketosteroid isomerase-like protein